MSRSQIIAYNKEIYIYICDSFVIKATLTFQEVFRELNEFKDFFSLFSNTGARQQLPAKWLVIWNS